MSILANFIKRGGKEAVEATAAKSVNNPMMKSIAESNAKVVGKKGVKANVKSATKVAEKSARSTPIRDGFKFQMGKGAAKMTGKTVKYGALGTAGYFGVKSLTSKVTGAIDSGKEFLQQKLEDAGLSGDKAGFWSGIAGNALQGIGALATWNIAGAVKGIPLIGQPLSCLLYTSPSPRDRG